MTDEPHESNEPNEPVVVYDADGNVVTGAVRSHLPAPRDNAAQEFLLKFGRLHNLSLQQHKVLAALLQFESQREALEWAGVTPRQRSAWLRTSEAYAEAEKLVGAGLLAEARSRLDSLVTPAAEAFADALDAEKVVWVVCPCGCDHRFSVAITDLKMRVDVAKEIFKRSGDLTPKATVEVKHRDMATEDRIAVAQIERALRLGEPLPVPMDVFQDLQRRGLLPEDTMARYTERTQGAQGAIGLSTGN